MWYPGPKGLGLFEAFEKFEQVDDEKWYPGPKGLGLFEAIRSRQASGTCPDCILGQKAWASLKHELIRGHNQPCSLYPGPKGLGLFEATMLTGSRVSAGSTCILGQKAWASLKHPASLRKLGVGKRILGQKAWASLKPADLPHGLAAQSKVSWAKRPGPL